jgi:hypothetical protein
MPFRPSPFRQLLRRRRCGQNSDLDRTRTQDSQTGSPPNAAVLGCSVNCGRRIVRCRGVFTDRNDQSPQLCNTMPVVARYGEGSFLIVNNRVTASGRSASIMMISTHAILGWFESTNHIQ